jgi:plastocyanin
MRTLIAAVAILALDCGGSQDKRAASAPPQESAAPAPTSASQPDTTGMVHDVQMLVTPTRQFVFRPPSITITVGDRVRWINVSGGPHNVAFHPDEIPARARVLLNSAMPQRISELTGKLLIEPNATYEISFVGLPPGRYDYYCTTHEMLGMTGTIMVVR